MMRKELAMMVGVIAILLFTFDANAQVVTDDLVSWWKFDGDADDFWEGPHYNHGTEYGSPTYTSSTAGPGSSQALVFDGTNDYVGCGSDASLDNFDAITLEAWIYPTSLTGDKTILARTNGGECTFALMQQNQQLRVLINANLGGVNISSADNPISSTNQWYHVVGVWDGTKVYAYVNDERINLEANYSGEITANYSLSIGRFGSCNCWYFDGMMDEVRIYNRALGSTEIETNYNAMMIPEPSALLLLGGGLLGLFLSAFRWRSKGPE